MTTPTSAAVPAVVTPRRLTWPRPFRVLAAAYRAVANFWTEPPREPLPHERWDRTSPYGRND